MGWEGAELRVNVTQTANGTLQVLPDATEDGRLERLEGEEVLTDTSNSTCRDWGFP
jgi:hypothetical protein